MPRWLEIALTLVLFAAVMAVASWAVNAIVPGVQTWLVERFGHIGVWILLIIVGGGSALYAYIGHRKAASAKPNGT